MSAPLSFDLSPIREVLARTGVETIPPSGASTDLIVATRKALSRADFAIAVAPEKSPSVLLELGMALGLAIPTIVLRESSEPLDLRLPLHSLVQLSLKDLASLEPVIRRTAQASPKKRRAVPKYESEAQYAESRMPSPARVRPATPPRLPGQSLEAYVETLFSSVPSLTFYAAPKELHREVDFAIWSDRLDRVIGNPILVEAKQGPLAAQNIETAVRQLSAHFSKSNSHAALLVLDEVPRGTPPIFPVAGGLVFVIDAGTLAELMTGGAFERRVADIRNSWAHGGAKGWH